MKYAIKAGRSFNPTWTEDKILREISHVQDAGWILKSIGVDPPQGSIPLIAEEGPVLTPTEFIDIQRGTRAPYFVGRIEYYDVLGHFQWLDFCYYIGWNSAGTTWNYCITENAMSYDTPKRSSHEER